MNNTTAAATVTRTYYHSTGEVMVDLDADTLEMLAVRVNFSASSMTDAVVTFTAGIPGVRGPVHLKTRKFVTGSVLDTDEVRWAVEKATDGEVVPDRVAAFVAASVDAHRATSVATRRG